MAQVEDYSPSIRVRKTYEDLPDLVQLETLARSAEWRGVPRLADHSAEHDGHDAAG